MMVTASATTKSDTRRFGDTSRLTRRASSCHRSWRSARATKYDASPTITLAPLHAPLRGDGVSAVADEADHVLDRPPRPWTDHDPLVLDGPLEDVPLPDPG